MRNAFIDELILQARTNPNIALIVGDLGYSVVEPFAEEFPERFVNAGVAEQNMMGVAAGMASEGYHVFTYSIANFPTFRCAEQIRNDIDYHQLPVTVVSVGGGLSYGALGYSHHAVQDYAVLRSGPNMLIAAPGDPFEVRSCVRFLVENPQSSYLRIGKAGEPLFHTKPPRMFPGEWILIKQGNRPDCALLTTGSPLRLAMEWRNQNEYSDFSVYSLPLWGMKYKNAQPEMVSRFSKVVTVEDHLTDGGFGSWMLESLGAIPDLRNRIEVKALNPNVCGMVGAQETLQALGGLPLKW